METHFCPGKGKAACGTEPYVGVNLFTRYPDQVTCPACLVTARWLRANGKRKVEQAKLERFTRGEA